MKKKQLIISIWGGIHIFLALFFFIKIRSTYTTLSYQYAQKKLLFAKLQQAERRLKVELEEEKKFEKLVFRARTEFGMAPLKVNIKAS